MHSRIAIAVFVLLVSLTGVRVVAADEAHSMIVNCEDATIEAMDSTDDPAAELLALEELAPACAGHGAFEAGLAHAHIYVGRPEDAERIVMDALAEDGGYEKQLKGVLGDALFRQEKFEEAESLARELIEDHPDFYIGYWRLGDVLLVTGDYEGVVSAMETANVLEESAVSYQLLTMAHFNLQNYRESALALQTALQMDIRSLRHTSSVSAGALSLLALGHYEAGRELLDKHVELVPDAVNDGIYQFAMQHYLQAAQQQ